MATTYCTLKTWVKHALCGAYKLSGAMGLQEAVARCAGRSFLAVLLFHRVTDDIPEDPLTVSARRFRRLCRMLRRGFHVVPLEEIYHLVRLGGPLPRRTVAVTFDDCYRDNYFAARVLAEHGLPATFFVPTAYVGTDHVFAWDRRLRRMPNLTWDDLREMVQMGHEVGSHTVSHPNLARLSLGETRRELEESKAVLEDRLGRRVRWFAYPFGGRRHILDEQLDLVRETGYDACLSARGGFIYPGTSPRLLPREAVPPFRSNLNLELHLAGCLNWVYAVKRALGLQDRPESPFPEEQFEVGLARAGEVMG